LCGKRRRDDGGQLALLDAMVFFAVSSMICATMASHAVNRSQALEAAALGEPNTDEMLSVFLSASVGASIGLEGLSVELAGYESFSEVLFLVSAMVMDGQDENLLEPVLSLCSHVLADLCAPWSPLLVLSAEADGNMASLLEVGEQAVSDADKYAASQSLGEHGGVGVVVTLVLSPVLLLHGLDV